MIQEKDKDKSPFWPGWEGKKKKKRVGEER